MLIWSPEMVLDQGGNITARDTVMIVKMMAIMRPSALEECRMRNHDSQTILSHRQLYQEMKVPYARLLVYVLCSRIHTAHAACKRIFVSKSVKLCLCTSVCIFVYLCAFMYSCVHLCTAVYNFVCLCASMYSCVHLCTAVCVCLQLHRVCLHPTCRFDPLG